MDGHLFSLELGRNRKVETTLGSGYHCLSFPSQKHCKHWLSLLILVWKLEESKQYNSWYMYLSKYMKEKITIHSLYSNHSDLVYFIFLFFHQLDMNLLIFFSITYIRLLLSTTFYCMKTKFLLNFFLIIFLLKF